MDDRGEKRGKAMLRYQEEPQKCGVMFEEGELRCWKDNQEVVGLRISEDGKMFIVSCDHEGAGFGEFEFPRAEVEKIFKETEKLIEGSVS